MTPEDGGDGLDGVGEENVSTVCSMLGSTFSEGCITRRSCSFSFDPDSCSDETRS
jgi:hypothetical protein